MNGSQLEEAGEGRTGGGIINRHPDLELTVD